MVIRYCDQCGQRVQESDLVSGGARELDKERVLCAGCAGPATKSSSAKTAGTRESQRRMPSPGKGSQRRISTPGRDSRRSLSPATPSSSSRSLPRQTSHTGAPKGASSNRTLTTVGIVAGVIILIAVVALFLQGRAEDERNAPREKNTTTTTPAVKTGEIPLPPAGNPGLSSADGGDYNPRALTASSLLEQARAYRKSSPQDTRGLQRRLNAIQEDYADTPAAQEAIKLLKEFNLPTSTPVKELPPESDWAKAISLLERADPSTDANGDAWTREGTSLLTPRKGGPSALLTLPYLPAEEYDVKVAFTRREGYDALGVLLPRLGKPVTLIVGGWANKVHGFEVVNGRRADRNPASLKKQDLINGAPQTLVIQVRHAILKAWLDGQPLAECTADNAQITCHEEDWLADRPRQLTIGAWQTIYEIRQVLVIERTGKGQLLR